MSILTPARLVHLSNSSQSLSQSWYFIAAATLTVCNQPQELPALYHYAMHTMELGAPKTEYTALKAMSDTDYAGLTQSQVGDKLREAILKTAALSGLPKCINSLMILKEATPKHLRPSDSTRREKMTDWSQWRQEQDRGMRFWEKVYGKISNRVIRQMSTAYPDLWDYTITHVYSPLLSYTGVLSAQESSLVVISCLIPQDVNPQLKGHLKGALNNGCTERDISDARNMAIEISQWCGFSWKAEVAKL